MKNYPAMLLCDFYKLSHREQYPEGTETIYSTWTPRMSRIEGINKVVFFGLQGFIKKYLIDFFNEEFFLKTREEIVKDYRRVVKYTLGAEVIDTSHIEDLHELGYLPIKICALKEGTRVPLRVPMFTIENTLPQFFWVTNYLETLMSNELWMPCTSATVSYEFRRILENYANITSENKAFVPFQGHDFSMRGMSSIEASAKSGAAHLLSFVGTDTIPAIIYHEQYYNADIEKELVGTSIPATEHSVMCSYGKDREFETYKHLITEVYPKGFVSIVSDTWDLWKVLSEIISPLKDEILARDGKVVIRPDSGDPIKILCGDSSATSSMVQKGVIEVLWDIFGGTVNSKGYKELNPKIGAIYGDAITLFRVEEICRQLEEKGFASTNVVYGIGSYTFQGSTRDTFGFALKSTYAKVKGEERLIFKNPATDDGVKKSQKGKIAVGREKGELVLFDELNSKQLENCRNNELEIVYLDGKLIRDEKLSEIRAKLY